MKAYNVQMIYHDSANGAVFLQNLWFDKKKLEKHQKNRQDLQY